MKEETKTILILIGAVLSPFVFGAYLWVLMKYADLLIKHL